MEITLRVAVMEDVAALQQLIPHSARELSQGFYTPQQIESAIQLRLSRFMIYCRRVKMALHQKSFIESVFMGKMGLSGLKKLLK